MGEIIEAPNKVLTKAEAEAAGIVCTGDEIVLSSDNLATSSGVGVVVKEDETEKKVKAGKEPEKKVTAKKK